MSDIKDDIIYKAALTFKHEELAGMYAICNKREQDLQKENARLRETLESISKTDISSNPPDLLWLNKWRNETKEKAKMALQGKEE